MNGYPHVIGESETLDLVLAGKSLARYGDGEFKLCADGAIKSQGADLRLSERLRQILWDSGECLVGIPNLHSDTPKRDFWQKYTRTTHWLNPERQYVSSFVTRPDSAPWINEPSYWDRLEALWRGRDVTIVRGSGKSFTAEDLRGAGRVTEIVAPRQSAFAEYQKILRRIGTPERVLLCLGPTATVLAVDLCALGVHAVDLGHAGMFWRKHLRGDPMWVSKEDKVAV